MEVDPEHSSWFSKMVDTNDVMSQHVVEDPVSAGDAFDSGDVDDEFEFDDPVLNDPVLNGVRSAERLKCYIHHQESSIFDALMNEVVSLPETTVWLKYWLQNSGMLILTAFGDLLGFICSPRRKEKAVCYQDDFAVASPEMASRRYSFPLAGDCL